MKIRVTHAAGMAGLVALLAVGCNRVSKDSSQVVASVGSEKITMNQFTALVKAVAGDDAKAKEVLNSEAMRDQRNHFLESLVQDKAVLQLAKAQGLDKDPKLKAQIDQVTARVYMQALLEKRAGEPSDAELKALLDKLMKAQAGAGKDVKMPPFEAVKPQLVSLWRQEKMQGLVDAVLKDAQQKYPTNYAEGYKPAPALPAAQAPQQPGEAAPAAPAPQSGKQK